MATKRTSKERVVTRREVVWVPKSRLAKLPGMKSAKDRPFRVWTLYLECNPKRKPEPPVHPVHMGGAFLEDFVHDWNTQGTTLRYYSRAMDSEVWILVEYAD